MILPTSTRMAFAHQSPLVLGQMGHVKTQAEIPRAQYYCWGMELAVQGCNSEADTVG